MMINEQAELKDMYDELEIRFEKEQLESIKKRKRNRSFHRLMSLLNYWEGHDYEMVRLDLTSAKGSNAKELRKNYGKLIKRVEYNFDYKGIENYCLETLEGNGVLHCLWAYSFPWYERERKFYIPQKWLSDTWEEIHGAPVVWITKYNEFDCRSKYKVSHYFVSHYIAGQDFVRYSFSWYRSFGFSLVKLWKVFVDYHMNYKGYKYMETIEKWNRFCRGDDTISIWGKELYITQLRDYKEKEKKEGYPGSLLI